MPRNPRPYQIEGFERVRSAFRSGLRHVVNEKATGTGKTVEFSLITKMVQEKKGRTLLLLNRDILVGQTIAELLENGVHCQREQSGDRASITADVVVASVQSLKGEWLKKYRPGYFNMVITDECHGSSSSTFKRVLDYHEESYGVGFTATPERHDGKGLWKGYKDIVHRFPIYNTTDNETGIVTEGAINQGWLCDLKFHDLPVPITLDDAVAMGKRLTEAEEENQFAKNNYLPRLFYEAANVARGKKGLAFWPGTKASARAAEDMREHGINARHIDSYMTDAKKLEILTWFKHIKEGVLCNSHLLMMGYNQPDINWLLLGKIYRSRTDFMQSIGRGTRAIAPIDDLDTVTGRLQSIADSSKQHCEVWNLMIENEEHDLATPSCLITGDRDECKAIEKATKGGNPVSLGDLDSLLKKTRIIDAEKQLEKLANDAAYSAQRMANRKKDPYIGHILMRAHNGNNATEGQQSYLKKLGYKHDSSVLSKQQAYLITEVYKKHNEKIKKAA